MGIWIYQPPLHTDKCNYCGEH